MKKVVCDICGRDIGDTSLTKEIQGRELDKLDPKDWNKILMKSVTTGKTKLNLDVCNACNIFIRYILTHLKEVEIESVFHEFAVLLQKQTNEKIPKTIKDVTKKS